MQYTHKGWFGLCPIYIGSIDQDPIEMCPRYNWLGWLFDFSVAVQEFSIEFLSAINPEYEPAWAIKVTGELDAPIER